MMGKALGSVVELFGRAATELTRGVIVIGLSLKAQVEMMEVLVGVLEKTDEAAFFEQRAQEIVSGLSEACVDMYSDKKEN